MSQKAERSQPVIDSHNDDALGDQALRVVVVTLPDYKRAAVNPEHHRAMPEMFARVSAVVTRGGSKHIQKEAIFRGAGQTKRRGRLGAMIPKLGCFLDTMSTQRRKRRFPAKVPGWSLGITDAKEFIHGWCCYAAKYAIFRHGQRARRSPGAYDGSCDQQTNGCDKPLQK